MLTLLGTEPATALPLTGRDGDPVGCTSPTIEATTRLAGGEVRLMFVVPAGTFGVVKGIAGALKPKKCSGHVPADGVVPKGSADVFEIASEVAKPATAVTNVKRRRVLVAPSVQCPLSC